MPVKILRRATIFCVSFLLRFTLKTLLHFELLTLCQLSLAGGGGGGGGYSPIGEILKCDHSNESY